jgi:hypothetical protein
MEKLQHAHLFAGPFDRSTVLFDEKKEFFSGSFIFTKKGRVFLEESLGLLFRFIILLLFYKNLDTHTHTNTSQ